MIACSCGVKKDSHSSRSPTTRDRRQVAFPEDDMSNTSPRDSRSLFMMLAEINERMIDIWRTLGANRLVRQATRGCDIGMFQDPMLPGEENPSFESYVEVETQSGDTFWWRLDLSGTSALWKIYRAVGRPGSHGEAAISTFDEVVFEDFSDMRGRIWALMDELADSARTFNFTR